MRDIAVVAFAQRQEPRIDTESEVEFMVPLMNEAKNTVGLTQQDMGFTCSGSSDFLAGQAFSFVMTGLTRPRIETLQSRATPEDRAKQQEKCR